MARPNFAGTARLEAETSTPATEEMKRQRILGRDLAVNDIIEWGDRLMQVEQVEPPQAFADGSVSFRAIVRRFEPDEPDRLFPAQHHILDADKAFSVVSRGTAVPLRIV